MPVPREKKTTEEKYQKLSQLEHVLLRPDSYVGSNEPANEKMWVWNSSSKTMNQRLIEYTPGLYKIFDEVIVNAADNFQRDPKGMNKIGVTIDRQEGMISVYNNGQSLPIEMHKEHKVYVPELLFGHLLTSDNYDDTEEKTVGGRNGYGAKLTNIFSTKFMIECGNSKKGKKYTQVFENNMKKTNPPIVEQKKTEDFTRVTFWPDFKRFGMNRFTKDTVELMERRVIDMAGITDKRCKVFLNDEEIEINSFKEYVDLFLTQEDAIKVHAKFSDRWEVCMSLSDGGGQFQQVSFVNSIATTKGGKHVDHVADQLVECILEKVRKLNKGGMDIKPGHVKNHMFLFVNCLIVNPSFSSQTKEFMSLKEKSFGSTCEINKKFHDEVGKSGIVELVMQWARAKENIDLKRKVVGGRQRKLVGIPKLEDANDAGGKHSDECTLILTEGDSAKTLAVAGFSVVGRDKYGVFPLRGKPLNVRDASHAQVMKNEEIQNIMKILGLERGKIYEDTKGLRYGSVMIMADQDFDGSHIKGLLINMWQHWWPSLFKMPGFIREFITPIVKVSKGDQSTQFFTVQEYETWKEQHDGGKGWTVKYYKGLGTSTSKEAKEYFSDLNKHVLQFDYINETDSEAIDMAFDKKRADDRKVWMNEFASAPAVDHNQSSVSYVDFVNKEFVQFARYDVYRMIPSVCDGLKPSQRKVLYSCFKRNLTKDVKVAQLSGYISEQSSYHHGEVSLQQTIVNMAQDFVGSNNINLLIPSGQFGTRLQGGKDSASARYIYTRLSKLTRAIFHPDDDALLEFQDDDGQKIEPKWYVPIIPTGLLNGCEGMGVGWSTNIPNYCARDLIKQIKRYIEGLPIQDLVPNYRNFKGTITPSETKQGFDVFGVLEKRSDTVVEIIELPVKKWTEDYKNFLTSLLSIEDTSKAQIQEFKEYHTETYVHFIVEMSEEQMRRAESEGLMKMFKLKSSIATSNMVMFEADGTIKRYDTAKEIMEAFCDMRQSFYVKRKNHLLAKLRREKEFLSERARFILMVIEGKLIVSNRKKAIIIEDLKTNKFKTAKQLGEDVTGDEEDIEGKAGYDYLLGMPIWSLTYEKVEELRRQLEAKSKELDILLHQAPEELWLIDLNNILKLLDERDEQYRIDQANEKGIKKTKGRTLTREGRGKKVKREAVRGSSPSRKAVESDEDQPAAKAPKIEVEPPRPESGASLLARLRQRQMTREKMSLSLEKTEPDA